VASFVSVPFYALPYPTTATQIFFPGAINIFAATVQISGGTPPYGVSVAIQCGAGNADASVTPLSSVQFLITPTKAGTSACPITFSDSAHPANTTVINAYVGGSGSVTVN
jgi:hypothetical protein